MIRVSTRTRKRLPYNQEDALTLGKARKMKLQFKSITKTKPGLMVYRLREDLSLIKREKRLIKNEIL